ncbi:MULTISPECIES: hypothetical protein [Bacillota]|uniref:hypothetical protein n=1 Tax=Bacillota TaxID=1239 RepID=UPI0039F10FF1
MKKVLFNENGTAGVGILLISLVTLLLFIPISMILLDNAYIGFIERKYTEGIDDINRDIYQLIDIEKTAFYVDIEVTNKTDAEKLFTDMLQKRFNLDSSNTPIDNELITGPIIIEQLHVVDQDDLPFDDGYGNTMNYPGVVAEVVLPIKTLALGIEADKRILVTSEIFR